MNDLHCIHVLASAVKRRLSKRPHLVEHAHHCQVVYQLHIRILQRDFGNRFPGQRMANRSQVYPELHGEIMYGRDIIVLNGDEQSQNLL